MKGTITCAVPRRVGAMHGAPARGLRGARNGEPAPERRVRLPMQPHAHRAPLQLHRAARPLLTSAWRDPARSSNSGTLQGACAALSTMFSTPRDSMSIADASSAPRASPSAVAGSPCGPTTSAVYSMPPSAPIFFLGSCSASDDLQEGRRTVRSGQRRKVAGPVWRYISCTPVLRPLGLSKANALN